MSNNAVVVHLHPWVSPHQRIKNNYNLQKPIIKNFIGAVSTGIVDNSPMLDLDYEEDSKAQVDANFVICDSGEISEIQVTGEEFFFNDEQFSEIFYTFLCLFVTKTVKSKMLKIVNWILPFWLQKGTKKCKEF